MTITSNPDYLIDQVFVMDHSTQLESEVPVAEGTSTMDYTFTNVTNDFDIRATFKDGRSTVETFVGEWDAENGVIINNQGSISPEGSNTVAYNESFEFTVTPQQGYEIDQVFIHDLVTEEYSEVNVSDSSSLIHTIDEVSNNLEIYAVFKELSNQNVDVLTVDFSNPPFQGMLSTLLPSSFEGMDGTVAGILEAPETTTKALLKNYNYLNNEFLLNEFYRLGFNLELGHDLNLLGTVRVKVQIVFDNNSKVTKWLTINNNPNEIQKFSHEFMLPLNVSSIRDIKIAIQQREYPMSTNILYLTHFNIYEVPIPEFAEVQKYDFESEFEFTNSSAVIAPENPQGFDLGFVGEFYSSTTTTKDLTRSFNQLNVNIPINENSRYLQLEYLAALSELEAGDMRVRVAIVYDTGAKAQTWYYFEEGDELNAKLVSLEYMIPDGATYIKDVKVQVRQNQAGHASQFIYLDDIKIYTD